MCKIIDANYQPPRKYKHYSLSANGHMGYCLMTAPPRPPAHKLESTEPKVLRGIVCAQEGVFKDGRGQFNVKSLTMLVKLVNALPAGLRSHFDHGGDGMSNYLGRTKNARLGKATDARTGRQVSAVRADLHLSMAAEKSPAGNHAAYVWELANEDPSVLSASFVLRANEDLSTEPPTWFPTEVVSLDVVPIGAAVDSLLTPTPRLNVFVRALDLMQKTIAAV